MEKVHQGMGSLFGSDLFGSANCLGSSWSITWGINESIVNLSIILEICEVKEIGRKSFSIDVGGSTLGMGRTIDSFSWEGTTPCERDESSLSQGAPDEL